ncbi:hypothetical protein DMENIID0001_053570 [Sergentomyia squamirostris]
MEKVDDFFRAFVDSTRSCPKRAKAHPEVGDIIGFVTCRVKFVRILLLQFFILHLWRTKTTSLTEPEMNDIVWQLDSFRGYCAPNPIQGIQIKERHESINFLEELIQGLRLACKVTGCTRFYYFIYLNHVRIIIAPPPVLM